jgi:hypothetical protein
MRSILLMVLCSVCAAALAEDAVTTEKPAAMKTFLDLHRNVPKDLTPAQTAADHQKDIDAAKRLNSKAKFTRFWYDKQAGTISCECLAPTAADCQAVHQAAGHPPDEIHEVARGK